MTNLNLQGAPGWVSDYTRGLDWPAADQRFRELEAAVPGIRSVMELLIEMLPDPHYGNNEFPVAAAVVSIQDARAKVISHATNATNRDGSSFSHAEMLALRAAEDTIHSKHLSGLVLMTTLEPCIMCCGAAINTDVSRVIAGAMHRDVAGQHARVGGIYKPWRTSPGDFDSSRHLHGANIKTNYGYMADEVLRRVLRTPINWRDHYSDPDAK